MATVTHDLSLCVDCTLTHANGADEETPERALSLLAGWDIANACPEDCEGEYLTTPCDGCGDTDHGDRHPHVAFDRE